MKRDHIPGFPNKIPEVNWQSNLSMFKDVKGYNVSLHLVRFHMHVCRLKIDFPEDCLMKIFMATLEGETQSWYESLLPAFIYCLKDFHTMFFERYKESYPSLNLVQNCCKHVYSFIEDIEKIMKMMSSWMMRSWKSCMKIHFGSIKRAQRILIKMLKKICSRFKILVQLKMMEDKVLFQI